MTEHIFDAISDIVRLDWNVCVFFFYFSNKIFHNSLKSIGCAIYQINVSGVRERFNNNRKKKNVGAIAMHPAVMCAFGVCLCHIFSRLE